MALEITPSGGVLGAEVRGIDLTRPLGEEALREVRAAWLELQKKFGEEDAGSDDELAGLE